MSEESLTRRYVVLTEGESNQLNGCIVLPGATRVLAPTSILPVTLEYDHTRSIGTAHGFIRAGVIDGIAKITFDVRLFKEGGLTHDDLRRYKPGVYLNDVFKFRQPGQHLDWITDGLIREISFYDPTPPAIIVED